MHKQIYSAAVMAIGILAAFVASSQTPPLPPAARPPIPEEMKPLLEKRLTLDTSGKLSEVMNKIREMVQEPGQKTFTFGTSGRFGSVIRSMTEKDVVIKAEDQPLEEILARLAAQVSESTCFIVTPDGFLISTHEDALSVPSATIPPNVPFKPIPPLPPVPEKLEDALAIAFKDNLAVMAADARLRAAQAELEQLKQQVTDELTGLYGEWLTAKDLKENTQRRFEEVKQRAENDPHLNITEQSQALGDAQAKVNAAEYRMRKIMNLRNAPPAPPDVPRPALTARPPIPEKYRQLLENKESRITINDAGKSAQFLSSIVELLSLATTINFVIAADFPLKGFNFTDAPPLQIMNALAEMTGNEACFVFRDYGVLVTTTETAKNIPGATVPEYIPYTGPPLSSEGGQPADETGAEPK